MEIDRSQIEENSDNENNDINKDDEEINNDETIIDDNIIPPAISNESRPRRNAVRPRRYRGTPPIEANIDKDADAIQPYVANHLKRTNALIAIKNLLNSELRNDFVLPNVPVVNIIQRRSNSLLAVRNNIVNINVDHQLNINDTEVDLPLLQPASVLPTVMLILID